MEPILTIDELRVTFATDDGPAVAVDGSSLEVFPGETVGIVGESGSGKSATAMAVLGLLPDTATLGGSIRFRERELIGAPEEGAADGARQPASRWSSRTRWRPSTRPTRSAAS